MGSTAKHLDDLSPSDVAADFDFGFDYANDDYFDTDAGVRYEVLRRSGDTRFTVLAIADDGSTKQFRVTVWPWPEGMKGENDG